MCYHIGETFDSIYMIERFSIYGLLDSKAVYLLIFGLLLVNFFHFISF